MAKLFLLFERHGLKSMDRGSTAPTSLNETFGMVAKPSRLAEGCTFGSAAWTHNSDDIDARETTVHYQEFCGMVVR